MLLIEFSHIIPFIVHQCNGQIEIEIEMKIFSGISEPTTLPIPT